MPSASSRRCAATNRNSPATSGWRSASAPGGRAELERWSERETCRALPSVLKAGGPASTLLRSRACLGLPGVGGPSCLLCARHLANHQFPGRNLLLNEFELRLVSIAIALERRLLHFQSVAVSKYMARCGICNGALRPPNCAHRRIKERELRQARKETNLERRNGRSLKGSSLSPRTDDTRSRSARAPGLLAGRYRRNWHRGCRDCEDRCRCRKGRSPWA